MRTICVGILIGVFVTPWLGPTGPVGVVNLLLLLTLRIVWRARVTGVLLGMGLGVMTALPPGPLLHGAVVVRGVVVGAPVGRTVELRLKATAVAGTPWQGTGGRVRVRVRDRPPLPGTEVLVRGRAVGLDATSMLPGEPDPAWAGRRTGVRTLIWADRWRRLGGDRPTSPALPGLLGALTTGDRRGVDEETWALLRRTGTAHLLAISGFHVSLVAGAVGGIARILLHAVVLIRPRGVPSRWAWLIGCGAGWSYVAMAGAPVSAIRAAGLISLVTLGKVLGREVDPFRLLLLVAAVVVLLDPAAIATAGFQLSFGAVTGLILLTHGFTRWLPPDVPFLIRWVWNSVAATVAATLGTLPAVAWWFQALAPLSVPANVYAIPVVAFLLVPLSFLSLVGPSWMLALGLQASDVFITGLRYFEMAAWTPAVGPVGALVMLPVIAVRQLPVRFGALAILLLEVRTTVPFRATFLDVGQGDATLIEHGETWLVDGGPPSDRVLRWLRRRGLRHLDVVVATHGEADHIGGLIPVLENIDVDALWIPESTGMEVLLEIAQTRGIAVVVAPGIHPGPDFQARGLNDRSLVLATRGRELLLTGDIEERAETFLASRLGPFPLLKVAHHGSQTSSSDRFLEAVQPQIAVISAGRGNRYGHPHPSVVERLSGAVVLRTDELGTIEVILVEGHARIRTHRAGRGWSHPWSVPLSQYSAR